ncbi:hypothetical protein DITRI_Ditri01bG0177200 [Diplodiscus trichospermus]
MADIGLSVASKISEFLVAPVLSRLSYVFGFASNVEDLRKETKKLTVAQGRLQNDVNEAIRQTEEIEKDVEDWLIEAKRVLEDVEMLENEIEENKSQWAIEGTGEEATTASLSELKSLSRLTALTMYANSLCLPIDFVFPKLQRYKIAINQYFDYPYPRSRSLKITRFSLVPFNELFCNVEYLDLDTIIGHQHLVPSLDQRGLNKLLFLRLRHCGDVKCLIHTMTQQVPAIALFNLVELFMEEMSCFKELCIGLHPKGFLRKLEKFTADGCVAMISTVPVLLPSLSCIWEGAIDRVSLQNLKAVKIQSCNKLTSLFPPVLAQGLLQLETLEIHDCLGLKHVITETIDSDSYPLCLSKLTTLNISSCDILEYVFPISMAPDFPELKEINLSNCTQLERVFSLGKEMDGKDIVLPQLRTLVLKNLEGLSRFCPENCVLVQTSLEVLEVEECPLLAPLIFEDMMRVQIKNLWLSKVGNNCQSGNRVSLQGRHRSMTMEYLTVGNCVELFQLEGGLFLSSMEKLQLKDLQELQVIWKGPKQIVTLQNLTHLEIVDCKRLRHIFSPMFALSFPQLKHLNLQGCEELEQIAKDETSLSSSYLQSLSFPNLTKIWIKSCKKLKCVFPISAACGLPKLEELKIEDAYRLKQVFGHEDEANTIDEEDVVLPKLRKLELLQLPNLVSFSPLSYHFMFPSPLSVIVEDCPNMTMCLTVDENNLMQARTQKLSLLEEKNCIQLSRTQGEQFLNLEELKFNNCGVEEVFQLKGLPLETPSMELKCYCSIDRKYLFDFYGNVSLKNLTTLELSNCKRLKKVFSLTIARNLPNLKHLRISECEDLEHIVAKDDNNERDQMSSSMGQFQPICFRSLHEIKIRRCDKLKTLFPASVALPHLEKIMVDGASELEQVFGDHLDDQEGVAMGAMEEKVMVLPMLWILDLLQLPRLNKFCSKGYHFVIPYLSSLKVKDCPRLPMTFFIDSEHSVHTKTKIMKANDLIEEDASKGSATIKEAVDTGNDIDWKGWNQSDKHKLSVYQEES